jgi:hypothetical protein
MIARMILQIFGYLIAGDADLVKIVIVMTDDALVGWVGGHGPETKSQAESDDENARCFTEIRDPQI